MKILAFDSTAKTASVALSENGRVILSYNVDNGLTQSELLLPMAESALKNIGITFSDIDAYAVNVGPGSFTGVRIGVSLVKGLAFAKEVPCIEVSTLQSLAENLRGLEGVIVPVMDARRAQVYTAIFTSDKNGLIRVTEDMALPLTELYEKLAEYKDRKIYLVGDGYAVARKALAELKNLADTPEILIAQNAASVARVAEEKYKRGEYTDDKTLSPVYLRMPQAERERIEKENRKV